jgi:SNF2 family DNA or RNA helicase
MGLPVFVNWAKLAWILGRMLFLEGIEFLYYFGGMTMEEKSAAVRDFEESESIKVMVKLCHHRFHCFSFLSSFK